MVLGSLRILGDKYGEKLVTSDWLLVTLVVLWDMPIELYEINKIIFNSTNNN